MKKMLQFQISQRVKKLLDKQKNDLQRLKRAKYMREIYLQERKRLNLTFRLSDFKDIERRAQASGMVPTTFVRKAILAYLEDERVPSKQAEDTLSSLVFLLRNMANNINQIAKQSNTFQKVTLGDLMQLKSLLMRLENVAENAIKKL